MSRGIRPCLPQGFEIEKDVKMGAKGAMQLNQPGLIDQGISENISFLVGKPKIAPRWLKEEKLSQYP